ncbi:MAG: serine/threonine-protein kinase [Actinomycetota bacterium]|nr:serine/threonine-protein kinase [Actinomycetota bacterium]MDP3630054.1 serine/threonine-protein kinase [Actinomycetota bacterium]
MEQPLILDRYRPLADLGSGGHGDVVLAFDTKMARRVAIKRLPLPLDRMGRPLAKAGLAEARTSAMLNHPSIVTVHEWDTDSDEAFIVMEAIEGSSLANILDDTGEPLTLDETAVVVEAVVAALSYAHDNGVLHLDLKPGNVLVNPDGRVKVADFGVSALTDASGYAHGTAGTIGYMPPEQLRGQALDERTDVWALAALVYELLTGANPFDADTVEGSLFKIEVAEVPAPSEFQPGLSAALDDVLLAALAPDAAERYSDVIAFRAALTRHLGDSDAGRSSLADVVGSLVGEDADEFSREPLTPLGLWDRLARFSSAARRIWAAAACGWLAWAGLTAFGLTLTPALGGAALVALAAALAPGLGLAVAALAFGAGIIAQGSVVGGIAFLVPAIAFWLYAGRRGRGDALAPPAAPALAVARGALATPLLLGYLFEPLPALVSGAAAALATMVASAATGGRAPFLVVDARFFADPWAQTSVMTTNLRELLAPGPFIAVLAWALAAALCSLACRRATRVAAIAGIALGGVALGGGYAAWAALAGATALPAETFLPHIGVALMLMIVVIALGAPTRPEEH